MRSHARPALGRKRGINAEMVSAPITDSDGFSDLRSTTRLFCCTLGASLLASSLLDPSTLDASFLELCLKQLASSLAITGLARLAARRSIVGVTNAEQSRLKFWMWCHGKAILARR